MLPLQSVILTFSNVEPWWLLALTAIP